MSSIVVGFIDTPQGRAAIEAAVSESRLRGAPLVIVHSMMGGSHESEEEYLAAREALERLEQRLTDEGVDFSVHEYVRGQKPAEDLVQAATEFDAELIVIGIRRRSATGKVLLGSNALDILHDSPVPVLCVKANES